MVIHDTFSLWAFSFQLQQQITLASSWLTANTNKIAVSALLKRSFCLCGEKPAGSDRAAAAAAGVHSNHLLRDWKKKNLMGLCKSRPFFLLFLFCACQMSNCMLCPVLHCLPLPHPHRTRFPRLLLRQSTPLPQAQPLTRWRGHLQPVVLALTQDPLLNLWPTHLSLTPRTRQASPARSNLRMGRWKNERSYLQSCNVTNVVFLRCSWSLIILASH